MGKVVAIFKQKYAIELFIAFKMMFYCCFSYGGNQDLPKIKKLNKVCSDG